MKKEHLEKFNKIKKYKLLAAIGIDLVGILTYVAPFIGEGGDFVWAPISGFLIYLLFPNRKKMALLGVAEELIPFADILPTAVLAWRQEYVQDREKTLISFLSNEIFEEQLVDKIQTQNQRQNTENSVVDAVIHEEER